MDTLIIGTGYLGKQIKQVLENNSSHQVLSSRRPESIRNNEFDKSIIALDVLNSRTFDVIVDNNVEKIIYCVSALDSNHKSYEEAYFLGVENIINYLNQKNHKLKKFIFISSTGVYKEDNGAEVSESSDLVEEGNRSFSIVKGEKLLLHNTATNSLILRLSGIYGPGREYLKNIALSLSQADADKPIYTNRIHTTDASEAVNFLINKDETGIYNISDTCPAEKYEVLDWIREQNNLPPLIRNEDFKKNMELNKYRGKKVISKKLCNLGFRFMHPDYKSDNKNIN